MASTLVVPPARAMARRNDVRAADIVANHPADDGAHRPCNYGSSARANGDPFSLPGLGHKGYGRQRCQNYSNL
jgi:hypothetical protein